MSVIENMRQVGYPNIYILFTYCILPLAIAIALAIKVVGFSKVRQIFSKIFAMHYDYSKD